MPLLPLHTLLSHTTLSHTHTHTQALSQSFPRNTWIDNIFAPTPVPQHSFTHRTFTHDSLTRTIAHTFTHTSFTNSTFTWNSLTPSLQHAFLAHADPPPSISFLPPFQGNFHISYISFATCLKKLTRRIIKCFKYWFDFVLRGWSGRSVCRSPTFRGVASEPLRGRSLGRATRAPQKPFVNRELMGTISEAYFAGQLSPLKLSHDDEEPWQIVLESPK